jgi:hypothetical protein
MKRSVRIRACSLVALAIVSHATTASAHHEAIFGPQSSLVLSVPSFVSLQMFSRQTGVSNNRTQETTGLVSAGLTPLHNVPLSLSLIAPASHIVELDGSASKIGPEDVILGARYRLDFAALKERWGREGNFAMGMVAAELPTGNIDHPAFDGPMDFMFAGLGSLERGPFSAIAYAFYRMHGTAPGDNKAGDNLFLGSGFAYTPWDDPSTERLISFQLGMSYETYFRDRVAGATDEATGGWGLLLHPTVVWGPGGHFLLFAVLSVPAVQDYGDPLQQDRWRVGAGAMYVFGR